jgi:IclR family pca regulon transcriptional regulator
MASTPATEAKATDYSIGSLARGLSILSAFHARKIELSLADIAEIARVSRPSALRIAHTMWEAGYLMRNPATKGYRLGPKSLALGLTTLSSLSIIEIAEPYLRGLRDKLDETVKMAIRDDKDIIYVARFPSHTHEAILDYRVGTRLPAALTSMGRAMLAHLPDDTIRDIIARTNLEPMTPKTMTDPAKVFDEIIRVREQGYSITDQGVTLQRRSAAAAITSRMGEAVAAINASGHVSHITMRILVSHLVPEVVRTASEISAVLPPEMLDFA